MRALLPQASSLPTTLVIAVLALGEMTIGAVGVHTALDGSDFYRYAVPWWIDVVGFGFLAFTGIGLYRTRLWAAKVTACLLYAVFFAVLILISMWFDQLYLAWYYWLLPLSLPVLGSCVYALRKNRGEFVNRL